MLFQTQMLQIFLVFSFYTVFTLYFHEFFLTACQLEELQTNKNFPLVLNLLFKTYIDCFC